jgi:hypothetical protein
LGALTLEALRSLRAVSLRTRAGAGAGALHAAVSVSFRAAVSEIKWKANLEEKKFLGTVGLPSLGFLGKGLLQVSRHFKAAGIYYVDKVNTTYE